jgi:hypothetical protein
MKLYIFYCSTDPTLYGLTPDPTGANLPKDACKGQWLPWTRQQSITILPTSPPIIGAGNPADIIKAIQKDGYWIGRITIKITERVVKGKLNVKRKKK